MNARLLSRNNRLLLAGLLLGSVFATPVSATAPKYDPNGNLKETQVPGGTLSYTYDALDRLKIEFGPGVDQSFDYDANGNRTGDATHGYTITPNSNRIQSIDGVTVSYDPAGNIQNDGLGKTYTYNAAGRLKEVRVNGTLVASYKYNYRGLRTHTITPQGTTLYYYDEQGHLIQTTDPQGSPKQSLHWADDQPIAQVDHASGGDKLVYLHADQLNTPRSATDQNATLVWRWDRSAFGETSPTGSVTVNLRYPGQYFDSETGLYYNGRRYYDPRIGRYISSDPIGIASGLNTYSYAYNNPLRYTDPSGEFVPLIPIILGGASWWIGSSDTLHQAAADAAQYWADLQVQTGNPLYAIPGALAALADSCTAKKTATVLGVGALAGGYLGRPFWQYYPAENPGYSSPWITRGSGWSPPYATGTEAVERLSLPPWNPGTAVRPVSPGPFDYVGGPRNVQPNYGQPGGGTEFRFGGFPP